MTDQDFLGNLMATEEPEAVSEAAPVVEETPAGPAPAEPVAEPEPNPEPAPAPEAPREEPRTVPLATFLDQRDRLKELERREAEWKAQQSQPMQRIDPLDDPEGFAQQQQQLVQQAIIADRFERSHEDAVEKHGQEAVQAAVEWAQTRAQANPAFAAEYMAKTRPIQWIVQQHKRDALVSDIGDNVDDWFTREAAKRGYAPQSAPVDAAPVAAPVQPAAKPAAPPKSIASERTAPAAVTPQGERDGFLANIVGK